MTLSELITRVQQKLGSQTTFYTDAEIVVNGINPAQRLMCLVHPPLNYIRTTLTVTADQAFIDLRTLLDGSLAIIGNRFRSIRRVTLGTVTGNLATNTVATGELQKLDHATVKRLSARNDWMALRGLVRKYWLWGPYWLGLYERPIASTTITILYAAAPAPLVITSLSASPDIAAVYHPVIAEIATGLLIMKEGNPQTARGLARIRSGIDFVGRTRADATAQQQAIAQQAAAQQQTAPQSEVTQ